MGAKRESREKDKLLLLQKLFKKKTERRYLEILRDVEKKEDKAERTC